MLLFFVLLSLLTISVTISSLPHPQPTKAIAELSNMLALNLHKKLSVGDGNVFFSPLSILTPLTMLFYGTRGKTTDEMRRVLGYEQAGLTDNQVHAAFHNLMEMFSEDSTSKEYLLHVANAVLTQDGFPILDEYKSGLQKIYKATARNVDFKTQSQQAIQEINNWVKQKTNNQITKLMDSVNTSSVMFLLNAVYFKGEWKTKFERTTNGTFFNKGLERVKVPMMQYKKDVLYTRLENAQAVELPYRGDDISMVIVLPDAMDGLSKLEEELTPNTLKDIRKSVRKTKVVVMLPKFEQEHTKKLNTVFQDLGIKDVYGRSADLSGISKTHELLLSEVVHKAFLEINEEGTEASVVTGIGFMAESPVINVSGISKTHELLLSEVVHKAFLEINEEDTEASAVTGIGFMVESPVINEISFVADHPFVLAIVDRRNEGVLLLGRIHKL